TTPRRQCRLASSNSTSAWWNRRRRRSSPTRPTNSRSADISPRIRPVAHSSTRISRHLSCLRSTLRADQEAGETADAIEPDDDREEQDEGYGELMQLSRRMAKRCGITVPQAFERLYTDPKNTELVAMTKAYDFSGQRSFRAQLQEVQKAVSDAYGKLM